MRAKPVNESNFERYRDPKKALGLDTTGLPRDFLGELVEIDDEVIFIMTNRLGEGGLKKGIVKLIVSDIWVKVLPEGRTLARMPSGRLNLTDLEDARIKSLIVINKK
jgi:hypothetical protein